MARLCPEMHASLNPYAIRLLNKNKIHTLAEFMREDENKLIKIMNIDGKQQIHFHHSTAHLNYCEILISFVQICMNYRQ